MISKKILAKETNNIRKISLRADTIAEEKLIKREMK